MENKNKISLDEIGRELPFTVPENYFNEFASQFEEKIVVKPRFSMRSLKPWMYMAAMFVGIFVISHVFFLMNNGNTVTSTDNYESYVLSQVDESYMLDYYVDDINQ